MHAIISRKSEKNTIFITVVYSTQFHFLIVLKLCDSVAKSLKFRTTICKNYFRLRLLTPCFMYLKMRGIMHARIYSKLWISYQEIAKIWPCDKNSQSFVYLLCPRKLQFTISVQNKEILVILAWRSLEFTCFFCFQEISKILLSC